MYGYAGLVLIVDLTNRKIMTLPTDIYARRFIGGRGLAAGLYWDSIKSEPGPLDPDNCLIFVNGPTAGFPGIAGSRWQVCGRSPAMDPSFFSHGNLGGTFGAWMKFSGYDGILVQGVSDKLAYLFVHDGEVEIKDAAHLRGKDAITTREMLKAELGETVRVATTGLAGENMVPFSTVLADDNSSGAGGFGAVMGSKNLKAVVVAGDRKPVAAHPEKLAEAARHIFRLRGQHGQRRGKWTFEGKTNRYTCFGCVNGCGRQTYTLEGGEKIKYFCHFADMYEGPVVKRYGAWNEVVVHAAGMVHRHALDSFVIEPMVAWLGKCYESGIISEQETGLPLSQIGTAEFFDTLIRKISTREGFGDVLALGTLKAAEIVGKGSSALIGDSITTRANDFAMYDPRLYITTGLLYATEPRKPIQHLHEVSTTMHSWTGISRTGFLSSEDIALMAERFWGGQENADMSTYDGKAMVVKKIQDRNYAKESLILCDFLWPVTTTREIPEHVGDPTLESKIYSAITGEETDESGLNKLGERVFNLQRAIRMRQGWGGRQGDRLLEAFYTIPNESARFNTECLVPGKEGKPVSRKGAVVEEDKFEKMKSEYYELRGWDTRTGLQTGGCLQKLGMQDVASELDKLGLIETRSLI